jgi:hypothetical protein
MQKILISFTITLFIAFSTSAQSSLHTEEMVQKILDVYARIFAPTTKISSLCLLEKYCTIY